MLSLAVGASYVPTKHSTSLGLVLGIQVHLQQPQQIGSVLLVLALAGVGELFSSGLAEIRAGLLATHAGGADRRADSFPVHMESAIGVPKMFCIKRRN